MRVATREITSTPDVSKIKNPITQTLAFALAARVLAADALQWHLWRQGDGRLCLFPDTTIYWQLAQAIHDRAIYQIVEWNDIPHFALRAPGYPLFIALCMSLMGQSTLAVRLAQALLGAACAPLVFALAQATIQSQPNSTRATTPPAAAWIVAIHPYAILGSVILLSEALFTPLMLLVLWGLAVVWEERSGWRVIAIATGLIAGCAILTRPSWGLFPPLAVVGMVLARGFSRRSLASAGLIVLGIVLAMAPWWGRNYQVFGRFVPTALWMGASLHDGLNPAATGSSDMSFMARDDVWPLDEEDQDQMLSRQAVSYAWSHPGRVVELAAIKLGLYWLPWPRVSGGRGLLAMVVGGLVEVPLMALMAMGLWIRRRDPRTWVLLAGPILYFCLVHLVFASSMRYRLPSEPAAWVLAAVGLGRIWRPEGGSEPQG